MIKASKLKIMQTATIAKVEQGFASQKLLEMGCTPGTPIFIQHIAPFGCPITFNIQGYNLALRKEEANLLLVNTQSQH